MSHFDYPTTVQFYSAERQGWEGLYQSEHDILSKLKNIESVLDIGCAAGGFSTLFKAKYVGVEISESMRRRARIMHPGLEFRETIPDENFDLVMCLGTLHHMPEWRDTLMRMWSRTKKYLVFDLRLSYTEFGHTFTLKGTNLPYVILSMRAIWEALPIARVTLTGYTRPSNTDPAPLNVFMGVFCLEREFRE